MKILVTGGSGFIGSALCLHLLDDPECSVVNVDKLTYAANPLSLARVTGHPRYAFERADIADGPAMARLFAVHRPDAVVHLAAESHVDRSLDAPSAFIQTNIVGSFTLLQAARSHLQSLQGEQRAGFRFVHVSTDEVFGSLGPDGAFDETSNYAPNSPYSASKAAGDHLARAWLHSYDLPVIITNCSNNYGPRQFPEKLLPLVILNALAGMPLPIYGDGQQRRDWLHVEDHARALAMIVRHAPAGERFMIGGNSEVANLDLVGQVCDLLDEMVPRARSRPRRELIRHVSDRPGHDRRYAADISHIQNLLGWAPQEDLHSGLRRTIRWYLDNAEWCDACAPDARIRRGVHG